MGGIALGIPGIMTEFGVDLNKAVTGVVSWTVFTVGIGVFNPPINLIDYRTFSGLRWRSISEKDPSSSSRRVLRSQEPFGLLMHTAFQVWSAPGWFALFHSQPVRVFPPRLRLIYSFSMNVGGGWVYIWFLSSAVSALVVLFLASSSPPSIGVGTFGFLSSCEF